MNRKLTAVNGPVTHQDMARSGGVWQNHGLSIVLFGLFFLTIVGNVLTGWATYNEEQHEHREAAVTLREYLHRGHFWESLGENWESEFLQMAAFVMLTAILYQKGSAESKRIGAVEPVDLDPDGFRDAPDAPWPVRRGGWLLRLYEQSLGLAFLLLFLLSIGIHAIGGLDAYNEEQRLHGQTAVSLAGYVWSPQFWFESFQNWQSEFLSLAVMVVGTIFLRQRGSAESKPVYAPHSETGKA